MELPPPPAWFDRDDLVPPPPPTNANLRSFGSPDFDEAFWDARPPAELCGEIKALNRAAVLQFCAVMRLVAEDGESDNGDVSKLMGELDEKFAAMQKLAGTLRVTQAREELLRHLRNETAQRVEAARLMRAKAAKARGEVAALLAAPDEPLPTDPAYSEENRKAKVERTYDAFLAHEAAERAKAKLEGRPPPNQPPWDAPRRPPGPPDAAAEAAIRDILEAFNEAQSDGSGS